MNRRLHSAGAAMLLLVSTTAVAGQNARNCAEYFLQELGWRFIAVDAASIDIQPGTPCERADLLEAQAASDLVVRVPHRLDSEARARLSESLLHHPATRCAY